MNLIHSENKFISHDGKLIEARIPVLRYLTFTSNEYGTVNGSPTAAYPDETASLTATPNEDCSFVEYSVIGGGSVNGDTYTFGETNGKVSGSFARNVHNLTLSTDGNGTLTATKITGYSGDTSVLTPTPTAGYKFSGYLWNGGTFNTANNVWTWGKLDGNVSAYFEEYNLTADVILYTKFNDIRNSAGWESNYAYISSDYPMITSNGASTSAILRKTTASYQGGTQTFYGGIMADTGYATGNGIPAAYNTTTAIATIASTNRYISTYYNINPTGDYTISFWMSAKPTNYYSSPNYNKLCLTSAGLYYEFVSESYNYGNNQWEANDGFKLNQYQCTAYSGSTASAEEAEYYRNVHLTAALDLTKWHYYSFEYSNDNSTCSLYVDGIKFIDVSGTPWGIINYLTISLNSLVANSKFTDIKMQNNKHGTEVPDAPIVL